jgi:hypothetical protein
MPNERRTDPGNADPAARQPGKTKNGVPTPPVALPHERDQAADQTERAVDPVIEQAYQDIKDGQVDTDMRATLGLDAERRRQVAPRSR